MATRKFVTLTTTLFVCTALAAVAHADLVEDSGIAGQNTIKTKSIDLDAPAFLNAYCLAKRTDEGTLSVAVRGTCKKVKFAIGKTWVTRQAQVHQAKFKITCSGY